jgi:IS5 family transposase
VVDRSEQERAPEEQENEQLAHVLIKKEHPGVDSEARWIKKAGKTRYGYKKHHVTDTEGL